MIEKLERNLQATCDNYMSELLDLYNCQDWGVRFVEFLEKATEVTLKTIDEWKNENVDEEG